MCALTQQTKEWHEIRRNKIGASDAPIIMGASPWTTPYQLWQEKLQLVPSKEATDSMKRGIEKEQMARESFIEQTGISVFPDVLFKDEFMMASLDGINAEKTQAVEIKCPGPSDYLIAMKGDIPEKYYPQLQHQLEVCGLDMIFYFSFQSRESNVLLKVYRDDKYIKKMVALEKEFFECMTHFIAPKLVDRDYVQKNDDLWNGVAKEWIAVTQKKQELEEREKSLREFLVAQCDGRNSKGANVKVSKILRKGNIDYQKIPELKEKDLEKYRKPPIELWRITNE